MRIGRFILILFLFCSLIAKLTGEQNSLALDSEQYVMSYGSSCQNDNIDSFNFIDENLFEEMEEFEESEHQNEKKSRKNFSHNLFALDQELFGYSSKYIKKKNTFNSVKYDTLQEQCIILLL